MLSNLRSSLHFRYIYINARGRGILLGLVAVTIAVSSCSTFAPRRALQGPAIREGRIHFRFYSPTALQVQLAGNWPGNNWARGDGSVGEANIGLMDDADGDGIWEIDVELPPGRYCYLFWVDETTWHLDPANPEEVGGGPMRRCSQVIVNTNDKGLELK